jgi:8-oxo-dGTP pyrophosphatase MutT (NUDIX family)
MATAVVTIAKALVRRPDNLVLGLTRSARDYHRPGEYDLPGGGLEIGETVEAGLARELMEEAGLQHPQGLRLLHAMTAYYPSDPDDRWSEPRIITHCLYEVTAPQSFMPQLSEEHDAAEWLPAQELADRLAHTHWGAAIELGLK